MSAKTIVLGLDGASWELIDRLNVDLPTLDHIRTDHVSAISESNLPPVTCPSWRCLSSGNTPGQLGVYWWEQIDMDAGEIHLTEANDIQTADLWDYLSEQGVDVGVVNMPITYPPKETGFPFVAGGPDAGSQGYTSPDSLETELEAELNYRVHTNTTVSSSKEAIKEDVLELIDHRFEASWYLYEEYDLNVLFTVLYYLVRLEHYYWDEPPVAEAWKRIDDHLSRFIDEGFNIVLVSDHGCVEIDTIFNINEWLAANGYIEQVGGESDVTGALASRGVNSEDIAAVLNRFGVQDLVSKIVPSRFKEQLPGSPVGYSGRNKSKIIDWRRSKAIASGQGPVYLAEETETDRLADNLREATGPNGRPIFHAVHRTEELYPEAVEDRTSPDLIVEGRKGVYVADDIGSGTVSQNADSRGKWRAENHKEGLFAASGPDISSDWDHNRIDICDIAPTVLHLLGCPVPTDMKGEVLPLREKEKSVTSREPIEPGESRSGDDGSAVEDRLEDLGYL